MAESFKPDAGEIARLMGGPDGLVWRDVYRRGNRVLNAARRLCPVDEGRLRSSLAVEMRSVRGAPAARIGSNLPYAIFVHEGTGIYAGRGPIKPVRAKVLRWAGKNNSGGGRRRYRGGATAGYVFARQSKGSPGRPFLRNALPAATGP